MASMYFKSRAAAAKKLIPHLDEYRTKDAIIIALSEGSSIIGAQLAMSLHTNLLLYLIKSIKLPGEIEAIAGMSSTDTFAYNNMFSAGQLEEMTGEYRAFIDQERMNKRHELNVLLGHGGEINADLLRHREVILVSDGLPSGFSIDLAADFLKTIAIKKLIIATPLASVAAVDRMHLLADNIVCLAVVDNYMDTNHYYDDNTVPCVDDILKMMRNIAINWKR